ncbi:ArsC/Spx/MgsR family protein [Sulfitobacter sp. D35]|uniref:arsenate reductase family protein n=1 Tax=Sulfitobacter sp. D35 TaxID=3083252 RepID=UPI00296F2A44|nr:ArsC/Spx/MgsR family protein [Sulfitobacter sp. D35]MDW4499652.1 ArsC/Spx/MgsR family protein [Sulfitobacter sp. D35]
MQLYGLKTCDTCRKALKALPEAELVDVRADGLPATVFRRALDEFGPALVNTRSTTWRGLDPAERDLPPADLIAQHPALMKRPLIDAGGTLHLGWTDETRAALGV